MHSYEYKYTLLINEEKCPIIGAQTSYNYLHT